VKGLLIANFVLFVADYIIGRHLLFDWFGLNPQDLWRGAFWQPFTYMFLHHGLLHLLFNMLLLWMFGGVLESIWGTREFLRYYFLTGVVPGLINCIIAYDKPLVIIGASGAIYGLLAAYGLLFPNSVIYISFLFPIRAKYMVLIFALFEFMASVRTLGGDGGGRIANIVHLGGMVVGAIYLKRGEMVRWFARRVKKWQQEHDRGRRRRFIEEEDHLRDEIDRLLDKINEVGFENLSSSERRRLKIASEKLRQRQHR